MPWYFPLKWTSSPLTIAPHLPELSLAGSVARPEAEPDVTHMGCGFHLVAQDAPAVKNHLGRILPWKISRLKGAELRVGGGDDDRVCLLQARSQVFQDNHFVGQFMPGHLLGQRIVTDDTQSTGRELPGEINRLGFLDDMGIGLVGQAKDRNRGARLDDRAERFCHARD